MADQLDQPVFPVISNVIGAGQLNVSYVQNTNTKQSQSGILGENHKVKSKVKNSNSSQNKLDLQYLASKIEGSRLNTKKFAGLILRKSKPKGTVIIFRSGKFVIIGSSSPQQCQILANRITKDIRKILSLYNRSSAHTCGQISLKFFKITNIIANANLGFQVNIQKIAELDCAYKDDKYSGVFIRCYNNRLARQDAQHKQPGLHKIKLIVVFQSGKIIINGANKIADIQHGYQQLKKMLLPMKVNNQLIKIQKPKLKQNKCQSRKGMETKSKNKRKNKKHHKQNTSQSQYQQNSQQQSKQLTNQQSNETQANFDDKNFKQRNKNKVKNSNNLKQKNNQLQLQRQRQNMKTRDRRQNIDIVHNIQAQRKNKKQVKYLKPCNQTTANEARCDQLNADSQTLKLNVEQQLYHFQDSLVSKQPKRRQKFTLLKPDNLNLNNHNVNEFQAKKEEKNGLSQIYYQQDVSQKLHNSLIRQGRARIQNCQQNSLDQPICYSNHQDSIFQ